jgi:hypothetical protein
LKCVIPLVNITEISVSARSRARYVESEKANDKSISGRYDIRKSFSDCRDSQIYRVAKLKRTCPRHRAQSKRRTHDDFCSRLDTRLNILARERSTGMTNGNKRADIRCRLNREYSTRVYIPLGTSIKRLHVRGALAGIRAHVSREPNAIARIRAAGSMRIAKRRHRAMFCASTRETYEYSARVSLSNALSRAQRYACALYLRSLACLRSRQNTSLTTLRVSRETRTRRTLEIRTSLKLRSLS